MLATWNYQPNNSVVQQFDPRARLVFLLLFLTSVYLFWDLRILALFVLLALVTVLAAHISWCETRRTWLALGIFIVLYSLITLFTGQTSLLHVSVVHTILSFHASFAVLGWHPGIDLTIEQLFMSLCVFARILTIASMVLLFAFTLDPSLYGVTFRGLGLPDKVAFTLDLTMRFVPSLSRDFALTSDAQRARGYELEGGKGKIVERMRRLAPLLVPVVVHSLISADELTDAMDLRAFGTHPRTWLHELHISRRDQVLIACGILLLLASLAANLLGYGGLWVPA